jgi:type IV fimbrial biogenesis protein FimT
MTRNRGFSLLELLVVMSILAIMAAASAPTLRTTMANARIRTAGESWRSGLELARGAAVRLNTSVEFVITDSGWQVTRADDTATKLHQGTGREGNADLTITPTPADADRITFSSFGTPLQANINGEGPPLTQIDLTADSAAVIEGLKPRRIQLSASGSARLCDPAAKARAIGACQ